MTNLTMSVGRDYRTATHYEYVIFNGDEVVARQGFYASYSRAKRDGIRKAAEITAADPQLALAV